MDSSVTFAKLKVSVRAIAALCLLGESGVLMAQGTPASDSNTVNWSAVDGVRARRGSHVVLRLQGAVRDGWHVYALKQLQTGPTPLLVALESGALAKPAGSVSGSVPIVAHDPAFGFDTPYYTGNFTVNVPVKLGAKLGAGRQILPVSVRFQTCNGRTCQPPKTVHLFAPITVDAG